MGQYAFPRSQNRYFYACRLSVFDSILHRCAQHKIDFINLYNPKKMSKKFILFGTAGIAALFMLSCQKEQTPPAERVNPQSAASIATTESTDDELDAILKGLRPETYLLAFDRLPANPYITKSVYGSLSEEKQYAGSPVPALQKIGYTKTPWKKIWIKTCPDMIPYLDIATRAAELMRKADSKTFFDVTTVDVGNQQRVIATKTFLAEAAKLQPDVIDTRVVGQLALSRFRIALPQGTGFPYATRGFYGIGDITVQDATGSTWESVLRRKFPNLIGCFDPLVLRNIRANFVTLDKRFESLDVVEVPGGAILGSTQAF